MPTQATAIENIYKSCLYLMALSDIPQHERTLSDTASFLWHLQLLGNNQRWLQLHAPEVAAGLVPEWMTSTGKETYLTIEGRLTGAHIDLLTLCVHHPFPDITESYGLNQLRQALEEKYPNLAEDIHFPTIARNPEPLPTIPPASVLHTALQKHDIATQALLQLQWISKVVTSQATTSVTPLFHQIIGNLLNNWRKTAVVENVELGDLYAFVLNRNALAHAFEGESALNLFATLPTAPLTSLQNWLTKHTLEPFVLPTVSEMAPSQSAASNASSSKRPRSLSTAAKTTPTTQPTPKKKIQKKEKIDWLSIQEASERTANVFAFEMYKISKKSKTDPFSHEALQPLIEVMDRPSFDPNIPAVGFADPAIPPNKINKHEEISYHFRLPEGKEFKWNFKVPFFKKNREKTYRFPLEMASWLGTAWLEVIFKELIARGANPNILVATPVPGQLRSITSVQISTYIRTAMEKIAYAINTSQEEVVYQQEMAKIKHYLTLVDESGNLNLLGQLNKGDTVIATLARFPEIFHGIITKPEWEYPRQKFSHSFSIQMRNVRTETVTLPINVPFLTLVMYMTVSNINVLQEKVRGSIQFLLTTMKEAYGPEEAKVLVDEACACYREEYQKERHLQAIFPENMPDTVQQLFALMIAPPTPTPQETVPPSPPLGQPSPSSQPTEVKEESSQQCQIM